MSPSDLEKLIEWKWIGSDAIRTVKDQGVEQDYYDVDWLMERILREFEIAKYKVRKGF